MQHVLPNRQGMRERDEEERNRAAELRTPQVSANKVREEHRKQHIGAGR